MSNRRDTSRTEVERAGPTPGDWSRHRDDEDIFVGVPTGQEPNRWASWHPVCRIEDAAGSKHAEADADLIVAAKDLLEALGGRWLIWSHEHSAWWKPAGRGYCTSVSEAGRYSFDEALKICAEANHRGWPKTDGAENNPQEVIVPSPEWIRARAAALAKANENGDGR